MSVTSIEWLFAVSEVVRMTASATRHGNMVWENSGTFGCQV